MANDKKITHLTGNVGTAPTMYGEGESRTMKIFLLVTMRYGEDKETRPVNVTLWEDSQAELIEFVKEKISVGTPIAVEGTLRTDREYNGVKQYDLRASRIGIVTWAKRANGGQSKPKPAAVETTDDDENEW